MSENGVPEIFVEGSAVRSDSTYPPHIVDCCACWPKRSIAPARKLLKQKRQIVCKDATAFAAMLAMSLDLLGRGFLVTPLDQFVKDYQQQKGAA